MLRHIIDAIAGPRSSQASFTMILGDFNHMLFEMILYYQVYL